MLVLVSGGVLTGEVRSKWKKRKASTVTPVTRFTSTSRAAPGQSAAMACNPRPRFRKLAQWAG